MRGRASGAGSGPGVHRAPARAEQRGREDRAKPGSRRHRARVVALSGCLSPRRGAHGTGSGHPYRDARAASIPTRFRSPTTSSRSDAHALTLPHRVIRAVLRGLAGDFAGCPTPGDQPNWRSNGYYTPLRPAQRWRARCHAKRCSTAGRAVLCGQGQLRTHWALSGGTTRRTPTQRRATFMTVQQYQRLVLILAPGVLALGLLGCSGGASTPKAATAPPPAAATNAATLSAPARAATQAVVETAAAQAPAARASAGQGLRERHPPCT